MKVLLIYLFLLVVNISTKTVDYEDEQISIDNQLLFQRLLAMAGKDHVELQFSLGFGLKSQPAFLFNKEGLMNTVDKTALPEALWERNEKLMPTFPTSNVLYFMEETCSTSYSGGRVKQFSRFASIC